MPEWDAIFQGGPFVLAVDMDLRRVDAAIRAARAQGHRQIAMGALSATELRCAATQLDIEGTALSSTVVNLLKIAKLNGIGVIFEKENINTLTESSEFLITLFSGFAQAETVKRIYRRYLDVCIS